MCRNSRLNVLLSNVSNRKSLVKLSSNPNDLVIDSFLGRAYYWFICGCSYASSRRVYDIQNLLSLPPSSIRPGSILRITIAP